MSRLLPPNAIGLAGFGFCLGIALFALAAPAEVAECPLQVERVFAAETVAEDGRLRVSYYALLRNPESRARAYGLSFEHSPAEERRSGARATLPGARSLPVLLGRETLPPQAEPLAPGAIAQAMRLSCRG